MEAGGQPAAAPAAGGSATAQVLAALTANVVRVATALGTTAGFVTFVAGTGGAITWVRFSAAGLPADQALAVVPKADLVAVGAVTLGVFIVLGLVAAVSVYAIDACGQASTHMRVGLAGLVCLELVAVVLVVGSEPVEKVAGIAVCVAVLGLVFAIGRSGVLLQPAVEGEPMRRLRPLGLGLATATTLLKAVIFFVLFQDDAIGAEWAPAVSVLLAGVLAGICFGVADSSGTRLWPYLLAVFFSVIVFGATFSTLRLFERPMVNPVGLLRTTRGATTGVIGISVARSDDRYWLAAASNDCVDGEVRDAGLRRRGRLFSVPRKEVVDDQVGALIELRLADEQARRLLGELIRRQPEAAVPAPLRAPGYAAALQPPAVSPCGG